MIRILGGARNDNRKCKKDGFSGHRALRREAPFMNLSKKANFSASAGAEKRPRFPRLKSRGPIEAKYIGHRLSPPLSSKAFAVYMGV